jgi:murein DD-endopeptidase MepM/ murein hydrolase activator NlpD
MMAKTIFSQMAMEIYAYGYISNQKVEKSQRENIQKLKSGNNVVREDNTTENIQNSEKEYKNTKENSGRKLRDKKKSRSFSFIKPVDGGITTSEFGDMVDRNVSHKGHDWAVNTGTKIKASERGVVELAYYSQSYGYNILIRHNSKIQTRYAHMNKLYVKQGDKVKKGQVIGLSGSTGQSTGPHLHFEFIKNGIKINPLSML